MFRHEGRIPYDPMARNASCRAPDWDLLVFGGPRQGTWQGRRAGVLRSTGPIRRHDIVGRGRRNVSAGRDTCPEDATSVLQEVDQRAQGGRNLSPARMVKERLRVGLAP